MAKKQLTPEQYKAKLEKRTEKRKKFTGLFLKTVAICVAIVIVYSTSIVAHTRIGLSTIVKNTGTSVNSSNQSSGNNGSNWNEGSDDTPAIPEEDPTTPSGDQGGEAATVMTSKTMQFDLFVKAFSGVKTNAKSVTILKKNAYNYNNHVEAGMLSAVGSTLMSTFLKEEEVNTTYTGADIAGNFPPSGATCGLTKEDIKSIDCKEEGDYYVITVVVKGAVNPNAGEKVGAVASVLTKQSIQDPIKDIPLINSIEPKCDYKDTTAEAKIEKSTGNLVEYYFDLPMILFMDSYEIGIGFEEWWTVAY
ncbi:MAG: hypothetical protein IKU41_04435 [Clostridia bacterium]|nr:hypothetical protein [Clostridia bacterium]